MILDKIRKFFGSQRASSEDSIRKVVPEEPCPDVPEPVLREIYRCNICGNDMWRSWDCRHWPGIVYIIEEEGSDKKREVKCVPIIEYAHLEEVVE